MLKIIFLMLLANPVFAAAGFQTNGLCFADTASALDSFTSNFPKVENGFQYSITAANPTSSGYQYSLRIDDLNSASGKFFTTTQQPVLTACDTSFSVNPVIDAAGIQAVFLWGFAAVVLFFFWGYAIAIAINLIKKV